MSQKEFADKIGMERTSISKIERGQVPLTDKNTKLICQTFNVREAWLLNGEGAMENEGFNDSFIINKLKVIDPLDKDIILAFLHLDEKYRDALRELIKGIIGE